MPDMWTAIMFDTAVLVFGRHIDNKLAERNEDGSPANDLRLLLDIEPDPSELRELNQRTLHMLDLELRNPRSGVVGD